LYLNEVVNNPLIYVFLGWSTVVVAHYLSYFFDLLKINVLNRNFQAFVINGEGEYWDGYCFTEGNRNTDPVFVYNDLQMDTLIKRIIRVTGQNDLYVRIMPTEVLEDTGD
jgi:hypothetical protein